MKTPSKEGAFSVGQLGRPASKRSLREGISAEKTPSKEEPMITSVYYYGYYKPYILKNYGFRRIAEKDADAVRAMCTRPAPDYERERFILNNSFKAEFVDYANGLSNAVNSLKDAARDMSSDIATFQDSVFQEARSVSRASLALDLEDFADSYNKSVSIDSSRTAEQYFAYFAEDLRFAAVRNAENLAAYGLEVSPGGEEMIFNKKTFAALSSKSLYDASAKNEGFFSEMYDDSRRFLALPLAEHLVFKDLWYYYNYKLGTIEKDSFKYIQSGMIVDVLL
ncbi:MAG: hypothetical protein LBU36_01700 [Clostridiales bacterium]|jgi:hypothetical protein|nr:hypothetical protein [Clostridiales bacterium]